MEGIVNYGSKQDSQKFFPFRKTGQKHNGRHMTSMRRNKAASTFLRRHVPPGIEVHQRTSG